ncbi:MAG: hypothetical protein H6672_07010 [Anaerolineaceae bacterium]|nr:hypothetical protein [Anaerolineaceae bacterium]
MARIVNPYNLDDDDDAVFSALLSQGLIWVEDDDEDIDGEVIDTDDVLEEARFFIHNGNEGWVNFSRLCHHLHETFGNLNPKYLGQSNKKYQSLLKFFADYPSDFELHQDPEKRGLHWIRLKSTQSNNVPSKSNITAKVDCNYESSAVLQTVRDFLRGRNEDWVNFSHVVLHMYKVFPNINLKRLKLSDQTYKSLLKLLADYPSDFELRQDSEKQGLYWIRLKRTP